MRRNVALMIIGLGAELEDLGGRIVGIGEWLLREKPEESHPLYSSNGDLDHSIGEELGHSR